MIWNNHLNQEQENFPKMAQFLCFHTHGQANHQLKTSEESFSLNDQQTKEKTGSSNRHLVEEKFSLNGGDIDIDPIYHI